MNWVLKNVIRIKNFALVAFLVLLCGCNTPRIYNSWYSTGIKPVYPQMNYGFFDRYQTIGTLSPELKWTGLKKTNETYEVCIWETAYRSVEDIKRKANQLKTSWGIPVFSTNNIATNFFQVPISLKPDTYYDWSVRIYDGEKVRKWSSFSQDKVVLSVITSYKNTPFGFKTPAQ